MNIETEADAAARRIAFRVYGHPWHSCPVYGSHVVVRALIDYIRSWRWVGMQLTQKGRS